MIAANDYQRLERAVCFLARHPNYPGKQDTIDDCIDEIEERCQAGRLTCSQKTTLIHLLHENPPRRTGVDSMH